MKRLNHPLRMLTGAAVLFLMAGGMPDVFAQTTTDPAPDVATCTVEMQMYSVATDITGDGLTSQTLPGSEGTFQILHEKWGDRRVSMEGPDLQIGEGKEGDNRVRLLGSPSLRVIPGEEAGISIGDPTTVQYFERVDAETFKLRSLPTGEKGLGISAQVTPKPMPDREGVWEVAFNVTSLYLMEREPLDGVSLNVGKPKVEMVARMETIGVREGEFACYRTQVQDQGMIYFFVKVTKGADVASAETAASAQVSIESKVIVLSDQQLQSVLPVLNAEKMPLSIATMEVDSAEDLMKQFDDLKAELISAPRITIGAPPAMMKIVLRNPAGGGGPDGGGFGGGGAAGSTSAPDPLSQLVPKAVDAAGTEYRDFDQLYRKLSPAAIVPDNAKTRGVIADLSEDGNGVLISVYPEPVADNKIQLDYLFQMRDAEGFYQFRQTISLQDGGAGAFLLPHGDDATLLVIVGVDYVEKGGKFNDVAAPPANTAESENAAAR